MDRTLAITGGTALLVLGFVALTGFRGGCGSHGHGHGRDPAQLAAFVTDRVDDALDDVDATPEQRARIHEIKDRLLAAGQAARGDRKAMHDAVVGEWRASAPDAAKLHALVDERAEAMKAFAHQAVDAAVEAHAVLTPEQRAKIDRKIERWHR
jgi:Spy/CpxP family protein refolding chaperone